MLRKNSGIRTDTFLVRVRSRRERKDAVELKGTVQHIQSQDEQSFRGEQDLLRFIEDHLDQPKQPQQETTLPEDGAAADAFASALPKVNTDGDDDLEL